MDPAKGLHLLDPKRGSQPIRPQQNQEGFFQAYVFMIADKITRLAESQASDQAIMAIDGSCLSGNAAALLTRALEAKRRAVETLVGEIWSEPQR
jgi:hypothetical protein